MNIKRTLVFASGIISLALIPVVGASTVSAIEYEVPVVKEQCKEGGWVYYIDDQGNWFKNQGDCVSFTVPAPKEGPVVD